MNNYVEIIIIVEGRTEQIFIEKLLAPYLANKNVYIRATQVSKPGQKGGDVHFSRVKKDLELHLKQRSDTFLSTMVDYYGVKEWPGLEVARTLKSPFEIAKTINESTKKEVENLFPELKTNFRFIPYIAIHEFEALLFSDAEILSNKLGVAKTKVEAVITEFESPEAINNNPNTAPSKRLNNWSPNHNFRKTTMGITIAEAIGIQKMRDNCPLFNAWLMEIEKIKNTFKSTIKQSL